MVDQEGGVGRSIYKSLEWPAEGFTLRREIFQRRKAITETLPWED